jgi:dTDP-4-amino-4,6-dideoxygalactose transaminase
MVALLARQISRDEKLSARRASCKGLLDQLPKNVSAVGARADQHAYWLLAVRCADPDAAIKRCRSAGFDATRGATSLRALFPGATPNAASLLETVVYLPHPAQLGERARRELAEVMADCVAHSDA